MGSWTLGQRLLFFAVTMSISIFVRLLFFAMDSEPPRVERVSGGQETWTVLDDVQTAVVDAQVEEIDASGQSVSLMSPLSAALWIGGAILLMGGTGAALLWRRAAAEEPEEPEF